ncbi:hypothetical protein ACR78Z_04875 [Sphingobacterium thalpophilum]|uniref:hypothetical protein n=1 Tax=Sphingobacterium thalpophilum TaxID=259 RepID=UPI003DA2CE38
MEERNIYDLFYNGQLDLFIIEGENQLKQDSRDATLWTHLAIAYHDQVFYDGHEAVFDIIEEKMIPYFRKALAIEPDNETALYHMLDYVLSNQTVLEQINRPKKHIDEASKQEFIAYARQLISMPAMTPYGYGFLTSIYEGLRDEESLLAVLDESINYFQEAFKGERETADHNISISWMKKIYLLDHNKKLSGDALTKLIAEQVDRFVSRSEMNFVDLAEIAYENNNIDLALKILLKLIKGENSAAHIHQELVKWHSRFEQLIADGYDNPDVFYYQLIIERNYSEEIGIPFDYYYLHALKVIDQHPNVSSGYHFAAAYLYDDGQYAAAIPYLQQCGDRRWNATAWRRLVECTFLSTGEIHDSIPHFDDLPRELYNEAVCLTDFVDNLDALQPEDELDLRQLCVAMYRQTYDAFALYFEEGKYQSDYFGGLHNRAMNCNNLALALKNVGSLEESYRIATEGLSYSDFQELHMTRAGVLSQLGDYDRLKEATLQYFDIYSVHLEELSVKQEDEEESMEDGEPTFPLPYLMFVHGLIADYHLGQSQDIAQQAQYLLENLYQFYCNNPKINDYHYRDYEASKNQVENIIYQILESDDRESRIHYYEGMAKRYPHEAQPYFVLMQLHNEKSDYKSVIAAGTDYLKNKRQFIINDFDKAKTLYLILKSHYCLGEFKLGAQLFSQYDSWIATVMEPNDYVLWIKFGILLNAEVGNLQEFHKYVALFNNLYTEYNWSYDDDSESVKLAEALAHYKNGDLKKAHHLLNEVLAYADHSPLADEYKNTWKKPGFLSNLF